MSYSRTIINGTSVSQEGGPSFDQELEDLQDQIDGIGSGSVPTGTGLRHVTSGVEDPTAYSLSAADIPGADTADAHQVPTSDGAGGFTWEDQAGGTPTTDAGDLTSGTLAAARLPGVLANVDTQAELLSAAGAQAAATGTPNGSKYLRDDNSWQAVSATDSTKLPLAGYPSGSAAMTGALAFTGTQASAGNTTTNIFRGSSGEASIISAWLNLGWNGVNYHTFGSTGWQLVSGTTGAGNSVANIFRNSGGGITSNAPTGGTHIATVNGARVGGFPLLPGDIPASACAGYSTSSQAISGSTFTEITWPAESVDTDSIHSTSSNQSRFVAPTAGKYLFATTLFMNNLAASGAYRSYHSKNGTRQRQIHSYGVASQPLTITQVGVYDLAAGDYLTCGTYSASGTYDVTGETFAAEHSSTAVFVRVGT